MGNSTCCLHHISFYCKRTKAIGLSLCLLFVVLFAPLQQAYAQCLTGTQFPATTFTPTCLGTAQTITNQAFAGEYANVNLTAGTTYTFGSSVGTDFITISNGTTAIIWGTAPLTWTATASAIFRFYIHTGSTCGTQNTNRTRTILCTPCITPTGLNASSITSTSATVTWGLPTGSPQGYQWEVRTTGAAGSGSTGLAASGSASPSFVLGANVTGLLPGTTYYLYVRTDCGSGSFSAWSTAYAFATTCSLPTGLSASSITSSGATISWSAPTDVTPVGYQWEVRTTGAGGSGNTGLAASGTTTSPTTSAAVTGLTSGVTYSIYVRTNCGGSFSTWVGPTTFATVLDCYPPTTLGTSNITSNSAIINWAIPVQGSPVGYDWEVRTSGAGGSGNTGLALSGSTVAPSGSATASPLAPGTNYTVYVRSNCGGSYSTWRGPVTFTTLPTCFPATGLSASNITTNSATLNWVAPASGSPAGYSWEVRTAGTGGSGNTGLFASGSTTAPTVTASVSSLAQGTAYNLYVRTNCTGADGSSTWAGPITFRPVPVNDLCTGAITLTCGNAITGTTLAATNDGITDQCGASNISGQAQTAPGVWYKFSGTNQLVTVSLCGGNTYDSRISVLQGSCGTLNCVAGNDDFCGNLSQVSFSAYTGTDYYILVHGFGTGSGNFTITTSCTALCIPASGNDNCTNPITLTVSSSSAYTSDNNTCATTSTITNPACGGAFASLVDVYYSFTTGTSNIAYLDLSNVGLSAPLASGTYYYALYTGTCAAPTYVNCGTIAMNNIVQMNNLTASTQYLLRLYYVAGTTSTAGNYSIRLLPPITWAGTVSTDWNNASNWQGGTIPNSSADNVFIPNTTNKPVINNNESFSVKNIFITANASLTINGTLKIGGTLTKNGTFTATSGTVEYNGSAAQTIPANTFANNAIKGLTINNSAGVTLLGGLSITGTLTPTSGTFTTNGLLTIASSSDGTGRIAQGNIAGGYITGNVTMQRYLQGGYRRYRFLSHPFTTIPFTQLTSTIDVTGSITGSNANAFTATASNAPSAFYFDETTDDGILYGSGSNNGWKAFTSASTVTNIASGQGIRVFARGAKGEGLAGQAYTPSPVTLNLSGILRQGNFSLPLSYSSSNFNRGWNLVGNPYASNISWSALLAGSTNVNNSIYIYRPSRNAYATYVNGSGTNGGTDIIESCNSFFVVANAPGAQLGFTEAGKTSSDTRSSMFRNSSTITDRLSLVLKQTGTVDEDGDEIIARFGNDKATDLFDTKFDAYDVPGGSINLFALDNNTNHYSIFHGSELKNALIENREVKLGYSVAQAGNYTIKGNVLDAFTNSNKVYLKDSLLQTFTLLNNNAAYNFSIAQQQLQSNARFSLVFNPYPNLSIAGKQLSVSPNPASEKVSIVFRNGQIASTSIIVTDAAGKTISKHELGKTDAGNISLNVSHWVKGLYLVKLIAGNETTTAKLIVE